jgi:hypothetical protein
MNTEQKDIYTALWAEVKPFLFFGLSNGSVIGMAAAAYYRHPLAFVVAVAVFVALSYLTTSWLHSTRWSGKPVILITTEAGEALKSGQYNLKTPNKEQLH